MAVVHTCQLQESLGGCINHWPAELTDFYSCTWPRLLFLSFFFFGFVSSTLFTTSTVAFLPCSSAGFSLINLRILFPVVLHAICFQLILCFCHQAIWNPTAYTYSFDFEGFSFSRMYYSTGSFSGRENSFYNPPSCEWVHKVRFRDNNLEKGKDK